MSGSRSRRSILALGVGLTVVAGVLCLRGPRAALLAHAAARSGAGAETTSTGARTETVAAPPELAPLRETVHDRRVRDALRERILAGWAAEAARRPPATRANIEPAPSNDGKGIDPAYIQSVVRAELIPMVSKCYEELLVRSPRAAGKVTLSYTILGEAEVGGVVDDVEVETEKGLEDEKLHTCVRESMASIAFRPPADGGKVTVVYPIELAPDGDPDP